MFHRVGYRFCKCLLLGMPWGSLIAAEAGTWEQAGGQQLASASLPAQAAPGASQPLVMTFAEFKRYLEETERNAAGAPADSREAPRPEEAVSGPAVTTEVEADTEEPLELAAEETVELVSEETVELAAEEAAEKEVAELAVEETAELAVDTTPELAVEETVEPEESLVPEAGESRPEESGVIAEAPEAAPEPLVAEEAAEASAEVEVAVAELPAEPEASATVAAIEPDNADSAMEDDSAVFGDTQDTASMDEALDMLVRARRVAGYDITVPEEIVGRIQGTLPPPAIGDVNSFPGTRRSLALSAVGPMSGELDLNTAVVQAVATHPSVARSFGLLYETLEMVDVAKAGYYPTVSTTIGSSYRRDINLQDTFSISASQMLWDFGKVSSAVDVASHSADRNRARVLKSIEDLSRDTATAFIEVQRGMALLDIARQQTAAIGELERLAQQRSSMGASSRSDVLQARSRREAAEALELQLQAELDQWRRTLQNLVGYEVPASVSREFPAGLQLVCLNLPENYDNAPPVLLANAELAEARARIDQEKANLYPTLSLGANYGNLTNPEITSFDFNNQRDLTFTLNVNSTLYQGGARSARRRAAEYSMQAAQAGMDTALLEVSRSFREARDQTRSLNARLNSLASRYDSIVDTQELYRQQYLSLGTRTLLDLLNTEQEIHQSLFDQVHTTHDLRRLQVACLHSVGGLRNTLLPDSRAKLEGELFHE